MDLFICPLCEEGAHACEFYVRAGGSWRLLRDGRDLGRQQEAGAVLLCRMCKGLTQSRERLRRAGAASASRHADSI
jgi:hypothetical protein